MTEAKKRKSRDASTSGSGRKRSSRTLAIKELVESTVTRANEPRPKHNLSGGKLVYDTRIADDCIHPNEVVKDERFWKIARTLASFAAESFSETYVQKKVITAQKRRERKASRIRQTLVELGPTFIKLGQFLSVRRDILSEELAEELVLLQDRVPPIPIEQVRETIEADLGALPEVIFSRFEETPIASASIGQVHRAWLLDGHPVAVKVQRPHLATRFYQDLGYMRFVTRIGSVIRPTGDWDAWLSLSDEFGKTLFEELDYLQEGKNADRIRHMLKEHMDIRIPRVFWKYTGRRVLTLEYIPGIKVDQIEQLKDTGLDLVHIGNSLINAFMEQVLLHGFFHADPHSGNMAVDERGNIVLYDFGMISEISEEQRRAIFGCVIAVIKEDVVSLVKHMRTIGVIKENANSESIKKTLEPFLAYYQGKSIRDLDFTHLESEIDEIADARAITLPPTLAYLLRAGSSLEGIARTLDPNFSFVEAAKPSLKRLLMSSPEQAQEAMKLVQGEYTNLIRGVWNRFFGHLTKSKSDKPALISQSSIAKSSQTNLQALSPNQNAEVELDSVAEISQSLVESREEKEIRQLKEELTRLENEVKAQKRSKMVYLTDSVWFIVFAGFYATATLIPETKEFAPLFLIGNVYMVAKVLVNLVKSTSR